MGQPRSLRAAIAGRLLRVAVVLNFIPLIIHTVLLVAGTFQIDGPASQPGSRLIGLDSLSIASFNGIIPSETHPSYLIHLQFFPASFTWSYPTSPDPTTTSGVLQAGLSTTLDPFTLIQSLPATLSLPAAESRCLALPASARPTSPDEKCTSPFWAALRQVMPYRFRLDGHAAYLAPLIHYLAILVSLYVVRMEAFVRFRPGWMRCQCWGRWFRRMCPLPKGTAEEVGKLPSEAWDVARVWMYTAVVGYGVLAIAHEWMMGTFLLRAVGWVEESLPDGRVLQAELGRRFFVVSWGGVAVAAVACACVVVKKLLMKGEALEAGKGEPLLAKEGVAKV